jgi:hypothetical protein
VIDPTLRSLGPAAVDNLYHVGYVVPDLLAAMDGLGRQLQITWAPPFQMSTAFETADGGTDDEVTRFALSAEGPVHLELIQVVSTPTSIFAEPSTGGFHHFGVYAERWRDEVARLVAEGMELERTGAGLAFVRDPATGVRIEVVSFRGRPYLDRILRGELGAEFPLS